MLKNLFHEKYQSLPFQPETRLERAIISAPDWQSGAKWGQPRPGHPEGQVIHHICDVLNNVDQFYGLSPDRARLRLIALIHDTFKFKTVGLSSALARPSHGFLARIFAENYIDDPGVLQVIECHDDAYKASRWLTQAEDSATAEMKARDLIAQLGDQLALFMRFYHCDNQTAGKSADHYGWFKGLVDQYPGVS